MCREHADLSRRPDSGERSATGLGLEMTHFVTHLHGFAMDRLMHAAVPDFMQVGLHYQVLPNKKSLESYLHFFPRASDLSLHRNAGQQSPVYPQKLLEWTALRKMGVGAASCGDGKIYRLDVVSHPA